MIIKTSQNMAPERKSINLICSILEPRKYISMAHVHVHHKLTISLKYNISILQRLLKSLSEELFFFLQQKVRVCIKAQHDIEYIRVHTATFV